MKKFIYKISEPLGIIILSIAATCLTSAALISQYVLRPTDRVFIGLPHYWEDYFFYLDQFYQGAHGNWLTEINFTTENLKPTLFYFYNIVLGKIGGLFNLEPYTTYNVSLLILKFLFFILSYIVLFYIFPRNRLYRFLSFIMFLFATSFPSMASQADGEVVISSLNLFRGKNTIYTRFENVPSTYIINIFLLVSFLLLTNFISLLKKKYSLVSQGLLKISPFKLLFNSFVISLFLFLLSIGDSAKTFVLLISYLLMTLFFCSKNNKLSYFIVIIITFIIMVIPSLVIVKILSSSLSQNAVYHAANLWDVNNHIAQLKHLYSHPIELLMAFGMFGMTVFIGIPYILMSKKTMIMQFSLILFFVSVLGFFIPITDRTSIPGFRFMSSSAYIFGSVIALYGLLTVEKFMKRKLLSVLVLLVLIINFITIQSSFRRQIKILADPYSHFAYMPTDLYNGFMFLRNLPPKNATVLANPKTSMDILIPGLTGKKTYSGHLLMTYNTPIKDTEAVNFFYGDFSTDLKYEFIKEKNIKYIITAKYSKIPDSFIKNYTFMKQIFRNDIMSIYTVD